MNHDLPRLGQAEGLASMNFSLMISLSYGLVAEWNIKMRAHSDSRNNDSCQICPLLYHLVEFDVQL
ncbi:uncharacterized protein P174DRAFT_441902 [Aspergillus novofumigatus IBT 16806]|uniref:Uncharacterized protein n=1 Tax=Aspergillus novofumigatus (strain IBT 16806) TaxID=1392255 RepID=A0A2I1CAF2_ASPN1|nr:uncharacterized protein P174DRAFT_441902 [Aspergillus novofumigatus IBT 16806]PKX94604.1 hypothetical protein P174DRAFT_441902 [Aspergillus novofumigatus IBT 16806]